MLKNMAYSTGTTISVNTEANPKPNMMTTAISKKNTSLNNGAIPSMVVLAAIITGRILETEESRIAL